jgi:FkbM family methyltransferase
LGIHYSKHGEPVSLSRHLREGEPITLIDVGAYNGDFTEAIDKYCGIKMAVLIEPLPEKAHELRRRFHFPKYRVFECVLSSHEGIVSFEINEFQPTSSILKIKRGISELPEVNLGSGRTIQRNAFTLDGIVSNVGMTEIDLLKLDVQGAEHLVLMGGSESLQSTSMIWIEVSYKSLYEDSCTFSDVYSFLQENGFELYELEEAFRGPAGELLQSNALFIRGNF